MVKHRILVALLIALVMSLGFAGAVAAQDMGCAIEAGGDPNDCPPPGFESWDAVLEEARGQTINWHMWGGSDLINNFVDDFYGTALEEEYGITLNRVPLADTVDAVNQVLSEAEAGVTDDGAIDLIWINGENFNTLKQADLLYGPWSRSIPNSVLVDWDNPAVNLDFGRPIDGMESPWGGAQLHFIYDSARMSEDDLPRSNAELTEWIEANPGRFTYIAPGPGAFQGTRFVKQVLFEISGGQEQWVGPFNQDLYDEWAPQLWDLLNEWEPNLWREGETYPANRNELNELFANGEIDFTVTQSPAGATPDITAGLVPDTARAYAFHENQLGDKHYVAIPFNSPNRAAALVLANLVLRPDLQAAKAVPDNWGDGLAIDVNRVSDADEAAALNEALADLGVGAAPAADLAAALVSDIVAEYQSLMETDWEANVLLN